MNKLNEIILRAKAKKMAKKCGGKEVMNELGMTAITIAAIVLLGVGLKTLVPDLVTQVGTHVKNIFTSLTK